MDSFGERREKMNILVTGGAGFIGSHICDLLIGEGHRLFVIDNLSAGSPENLNKLVKFYNIDLGDCEKVRQVFSDNNIEAVYHCAAQIDVRKSVEDPVNDARENILNTLKLLEICSEFHIWHFIFSSTGGAIYGNAKIPNSEEMDAMPVSPYGCAKLAIEKYLNYFHEVRGLQFTILRYSNVYGPRQNSRGEAGVIAIFIDAMLRGKPPIIYGGNQTRDFVFAGDVAKANLLALNRPKNSFYNVGTGVETSVNELFIKINGLFGGKFRSAISQMRRGEQLRSCLNIEKVKTALGWSPEIILDEGLARTYSWIKRVYENEKRR